MTIPDHHSFRPELAAKYGIIEAILLETFIYQCTHKVTKKSNIWERRAWYRANPEELHERYHYFKPHQIKYALDSIIKQKALLKHRFTNSNSYALSEQLLADLPENVSEIHLRLLGKPLNAGDELEQEDLPMANPESNVSLVESADAQLHTSRSEGCARRERNVERIWKHEIVQPLDEIVHQLDKSVQPELKEKTPPVKTSAMYSAADGSKDLRGKPVTPPLQLANRNPTGRPPLVAPPPAPKLSR